MNKKTIVSVAALSAGLYLNCFAGDIKTDLDSADWKVRKSAVESISKSELENKIDLIIRVINDKRDDIRLAAVKALIEVGGPEIIAPLTEFLKDDKNLVRSAALGGLIGLGETAADSIGVALKDTDSGIRQSAVQALIKMENSIALKYLDISIEDPSESIRELSMDSAFAVYNSSGGNNEASAVIKIISRAFDDGKKELRFKAVKYVAAIGGTDTISALSVAVSHPDPLTRRAIVDVLGKIGGEPVVEPLSKVLNDKDYDIRLAALESLARTKTPSALKALAKAMADKDYRIKKKIVKLLAVYGDATVVEDLGKALDDKSWDIRLSAVYALGAIGNSNAVDKLCDAMKDRDKEVQKAAIRMLKVSKSSRSVKKLGEFFVENKDFRKDIAEALAETHNKEALSYLLEVLPSEKDQTKEAIEKAIEKILSQ